MNKSSSLIKVINFASLNSNNKEMLNFRFIHTILCRALVSGQRMFHGTVDRKLAKMSIQEEAKKRLKISSNLKRKLILKTLNQLTGNDTTMDILHQLAQPH